MTEAREDSVIVFLNGIITIDPLGNDAGVGLTLVGYGQPASGMLVYNGNGTFSYKSREGFVGEDAFSYSVRDINGVVSTAVVTISVLAQNNAPIAYPDVVVARSGVVVEIRPLTNDVDPEGGSLTVYSLSNPANGSISLKDHWTFVYKSNNDFIGEDSFDYSIADNRGSRASATVRVRVGDANIGPVASGERVTTTQGREIEINLLANDVGLDGEPLKLLAVGLPVAGTLRFRSAGMVSYIPEPGFVGIDRFGYSVSDSGGLTASAEVVVEVLAPNAVPTPMGDLLEVDSGGSVIVDVLANDRDPDGDNLSLTTLSVPVHGMLAIDPEGRVVYTPTGAFVGQDSFAYTVSDGRGGSASATVRINVTREVDPTTFPGGYLYRRQLEIPVASIRGDRELLNFPLLVSESGDWLKTVAQGGRIFSADGHDIRFELADGTRLDHDIDQYDGTVGSLNVWVRLPILSPGEQASIFCLYGRPGSTSLDYSPRGVWQDYSAIWHLPSLTDRTGRGRDLVGSSVVAAPSLLGSGASFDGQSDVLRLDDSSFMSNRSSLSIQLWAKSQIDGTRKGLVMVGDPSGSDADASMVLRYDDRGAYGRADRIIGTELQLLDGRMIRESAAGQANTDSRSIALIFDTGRDLRMYLDGEEDLPTYQSNSASVGARTVLSGPLRIGTGPYQNSVGTWDGWVDEIRIRPTALEGSWLAMEHVNQRFPDSFYGLGGEDRFGDGSRSAIAIPIHVTTNTGRSIEIRPAAAAVDPDQQGGLVIDAVAEPAKGSASLAGDVVTYTPAIGFLGIDRFAVTISKAGKKSKALVVVEVNGGSDVGSLEEDKSFGGALYGNPYHVDKITSVTIDPTRSLSKRFIAERSGYLSAIRWQNFFARSTDAFVSGDGGEILIAIQSDDAGVPSRITLGETLVNGGLGKPINQSAYPVWSLRWPVSLEIGRPYHIVWHQVGQTGTIAVDYHAANVPIALGEDQRGGPYEGDGWSVLRRDSVGGLWRQLGEHGGFLQLQFEDGHTTGNPIIESRPSLAKNFGGSYMVRQRFTVGDYSRIIDGIWFRIHWYSGASSPLFIRLETIDGTLLEELKVSREELSKTSNVGSDPGSPPARWVYKNLAAARTLEHGQSYVVRFGSAELGYLVQPNILGNSQTHGATSRNLWLGARAETSIDGGITWRGWDDSGQAAGIYRYDCSLPVAFTVVGPNQVGSSERRFSARLLSKLRPLDEKSGPVSDMAIVVPPSALPVLPALSSSDPDIFLDPEGGDDSASGTSNAAAVKSIGAAFALLQPNGTLGIKRGSVLSEPISISGSQFAGVSIIAYGAGPAPVLRKWRSVSGWIRHGNNVWRASLGALEPGGGWGLSATPWVQVGSVWACFNVNSVIDVRAPTRYFHDTTNGFLYVYSLNQPTAVAVPVETHALSIQGVDGVTIRDIRIDGARVNAIYARGCPNLSLDRVIATRAGLAGVYISGGLGSPGSKNTRIYRSLVEHCRGSGISVSTPWNAAAARPDPSDLSGLEVIGNCVRHVCAGPPAKSDFIFDYGAGIKIFHGLNIPGQIASSAVIDGNVVFEAGELGAASDSAGKGIWVDSWPHPCLTKGNVVTFCRGPGILVELSPASVGAHSVSHNRVVDCAVGQSGTGPSGGICLYRGSTNIRVNQNTVYGRAGIGLVVQGRSGVGSTAESRPTQAVTGCEINNNILRVLGELPAIVERPVAANAANAFNRNCIGPDRPGLIRFHATDEAGLAVYSGSGWDAARGTSTSSLAQDPQLAAPPRDVSLLPSSPCIDAASNGSDIGYNHSDPVVVTPPPPLPPPPPPAESTLIRVSCACDPAGNATDPGPWAKIRMRVNGQSIGDHREITATRSLGQRIDIDFVVPLAKMTIQSLGVEFINDFYAAPLDRNAVIYSVTVEPGSSPLTLYPGDGILFSLAGTPSTGQENMWSAGELRWADAGVRLGNQSSNPAIVTGLLTRVDNTLAWNGSTTKLSGGNAIPMGVFSFDGPPTWTQAKQDRAYDQIRVIKDTFGFNYIRLCLAPGMYRYWNDPARNRLWSFLDGYFDRCLVEGMFVELNWWTVSAPDGVRADDSFFPQEYAPGYDSSFALCREFWAAAAARYKDRGYVIFSIWDEPIKKVATDTWAQWCPYAQELVSIIRNAGATNLISIPGNHYSMMFQEILTTHPIVDPTENWAFRFHAFAGAGEPQNYDLFTRSGGTLLDSVRPFIVGGAGHEPVTLLEPSPGPYKEWLTTDVYTKADALAWWCLDAWATPNLYQTGFPTEAATTLTNYGLYAKGNPLNSRLRPSGTVSPPSPTGEFAPTLFIDTVNGNDSNDGRSANKPKRSWSSIDVLVSAGDRIGIARGSAFNQRILINSSKYNNVTIGSYGIGNKPLFRYSQFPSGVVRHTGNTWKVILSSLPQSSQYASARVSRATNVVVDGTKWLYWHVNSIAEVNEPFKFFHDTTNGTLYFSDSGTPTSVEVPIEDPIVCYGVNALILQDLAIASARCHGVSLDNMPRHVLRRLSIKYCGLQGIYSIGASNTDLPNCVVDGCNIEYTHGSGIGYTATGAGAQPNKYTNLAIENNTLQYTCIGEPWVRSGVTSDDFYSGGIKLFGGIHDKTVWSWTGSISDNTIEFCGTLDRSLEGDQGQAIWIDTVTGSIQVLRNVIRQTRAAGVFVEFCPGQDHEIGFNTITDTGLRKTFWSGGICFGRGTSNAKAYHNTIWNARYAGIVIQGLTGDNTSPGAGALPQKIDACQIHDNIVIPYGSDPAVIERPAGGSRSAFNKNCFGNPTSNRYLFSATDPNGASLHANASAWEAARAAAADSIEADPLLVSPPSDVKLRDRSPCANAASDTTNVGFAQNSVLPPLPPPPPAPPSPPPASPPPPPSALTSGQPPIPQFPGPQDLYGNANVYLDTVGGNDSNNGTAPTSPLKSWGRAAQLMGPNKKLAIRTGSTINQFVQISGWGGATIGMYGSGSRPVFKHSRFYSGSQIESVRINVWRVNIGAMPQSTAFAAARVTHATIVVVNDSHVCSWYAKNGSSEVGARNDMFWHSNSYLYFSSPVSPTLVEVPWEDSFHVFSSDGIVLQDVVFGGSRGHGVVMGQIAGATIRRCQVRRCGLTGIYWQSKSNQITFDVVVEDNLIENCHSEGMALNWPGNVRNCFRRTKVRRNIVRRCCMGPPFILSGTTSQDYYSAGIKLFTETWESPAWDNDVEIYHNLIEDLGNNDTPFVYSGSYRYDGVNGYESNQAMGIWPDTVTGGSAGVVRIYENTIRRTWAAGVFIENCPNSPHEIYENIIEEAGLRLTGWSGGLCNGRGSSGAKFYKNTLRHCGYAGLIMQGGAGSVKTGDGRTINERVGQVDWRDNIVYARNNTPVVLDRSGNGGSGTTFRNNCFFGGPFLYRSDTSVWSNATSYANASAFQTARGGGVFGSIEADPRLADPNGGNYRLQAGSPCLGSATDGANIGAAEGNN